ncbi:MAG: hypothetical protein HRU49_07105 [Winogradskyella sp.]|uniref:hypothetical protein n=1 Tax=Winogradskyella sp. TaxID=1883156 RepID=UPI0025F5AC14|nr:hypothetical protein [Winogradskyella sp.]NRB83527.1 hypothetical protein [Winogradskyella sp.]
MKNTKTLRLISWYLQIAFRLFLPVLVLRRLILNGFLDDGVTGIALFLRIQV